MNEPLTVRPTKRAARQIREAAAWWEQNRPAAPGAVREEVEQAFALLSRQPRVGARARNIRTKGVRRIHLSRIRYYLFYRVKGSAVEVLAFLAHESRLRANRLVPPNQALQLTPSSGADCQRRCSLD